MIIISSISVGYNFVFLIAFCTLEHTFAALDFKRHLGLKNEIFFIVTAFLNVQLWTSCMMLISCSFYQLLALNNHLKICISLSDSINIIRIIKKTLIMFDKLCDAFESISAFYMLNNLICLCCFLYFNVFLFYVFYVFLKNPSDFLFYFALTSLMCSLLYAPLVFHLMVYSSWLQSEGNKTADLIQQLANKDKSLRSLESSVVMMLFVSHRKPKITCGLFDLNWKTFFGIMASIFSFSIIAIQFYDVSNG